MLRNSPCQQLLSLITHNDKLLRGTHEQPFLYQQLKSAHLLPLRKKLTGKVNERERQSPVVGTMLQGSEVTPPK